MTNNNAAITFSSAPAVSVAGRHFKVEGHPDVFIISTHTAATAAATLDTVYTGDTAAAAAYKVMKLDYDLAADVIHSASPRSSCAKPSSGLRRPRSVSFSFKSRYQPRPQVTGSIRDRIS